MKIKHNIKTLLSLSILVAMTGGASAAPIGTPAATKIDNTASISYSVGSTAQTPIASSPDGNSVAGTAGAPTTFVVDKKIDLLVTGGDTTVVVPGQTGANDNTELKYTLLNEGNSTEKFDLTVSDALALAPGDEFNTSGCVVTAPTALPVSIASGDTETVVVECDIPASSATVINGTSSIVDVMAEVNGVTATLTADDPDVVDVVFADGTGTDTDGADRNAKHSATGTYNIATAALTVKKTESVSKMTFNFDDQGTPSATDTDVTGGYHIPGSTIIYTIEVDNTAGEAEKIVISDTLNSNLTFVSCKVGGSPSALVPANPSCAAAGQLITSDPFTLTDGSTTPQKATMIIEATVK